MSDDAEEYMGASALDDLQVIEDLQVRYGTALMTVDGEPKVARTMVMHMVHHRNNDPDDPGHTTSFGMDQDISVGVTGALLYSMHQAYGSQVVEELLAMVAEHLARDEQS